MLRKIISAPLFEPVSINEVYDHTTTDVENKTYLELLIPRARKRFEQRTGRLLVQQTWQIALPKFANSIVLPYAPLQSINFIKYIDNLGQLITIPASDYRIVDHGLTATITPKLGGSWPSVGFKVSDAVQIECVFGHAPLNGTNTAIDTDNIIDVYQYEIAKQAILILIADWFANREDSAPVQLYDVPNAFKAICSELAVELL